MAHTGAGSARAGRRRHRPRIRPWGDGDGGNSAETVGEDECSLVHNLDACDDASDGSQEPSSAPVCAEDVPDCDDTIVVGDEPITSADDIAPDECSFVHNIDACDAEDCERLEMDAETCANLLDPEKPVSSDEQPPVTSGDDIAPDECSLVHNPDGCAEPGNPEP